MKITPDMSNRMAIFLCAITILIVLCLVRLIELGEEGRFRKAKEPTDREIGTHILDTCGVEVWKLWHEQKAIAREKARRNGVVYYKMLED